MAIKLTDKAVKGAKPSEVRQELADALLPGLYLVVQPSGVKSWAVRYRVNGRSTKFTLGRYPPLGLGDARLAGADVLRQALEGRDPAERKRQDRRAAKSPDRKPRSHRLEFGEALSDFISLYAKERTRDWKNTESMLRRLFLPHFKGVAVADIQKRDVLDILDDLVADGMGPGANRALAQLRRMFNWLIEKDRIKSNPCAGIPKLVRESSRERFLTDSEIAMHWLASDRLPYPWGPAFKLLLMTGQRLQEIAAATWGEVNDGQLSLPGARTKNGRSHDLPLPRQAKAIIEALPRIPYTDEEGRTRTSAFLFTTTGYSPIQGFNKKSPAHAKLMTTIARERTGDEEIEIDAFTNHDLRRTFSTCMGKLRVPLVVVEAVLNHATGANSGVAKIYNRHDYSEEKAEALQTWADHIDLLVAKYTGENVVELMVKK